MRVRHKVKLKNPDELLKLIFSNGFSRVTFAERVKISNPYLSEIINEKKNCSGKIAKKISDALGVDFNEVFYIDVCREGTGENSYEETAQ